MDYVIDTNIFIRFFTKDSSLYQEKAKKIILMLYNGEIEAYLCESVFTEVFYVLKRLYKWSDLDIAEAVGQVLSLNGIVTEQKKLYLYAIDTYLQYNFLDIEDCIVIESAKQYKKQILSFDTDFDKVTGITRVAEVKEK